MSTQRLIAEFDRVAEAPDAVQRLRQFILDLAVRGKLVLPEATEEPVDRLIAVIESARQAAVAAGQVKRLEDFERVDDDLPFDAPPTWAVVRMSWLAIKLGAGSTPLGGKEVYQPEGVPFLRSQNVYNAGLKLDDVARIPRRIHEDMSGTHVRSRDILLNITGASIGRAAVVPDEFEEGNVSQHVAIVRLFSPEIRQFVHMALISPTYQQLIDDVQVGVSREGLSMQRLREFPIPLPPLAEQRRIVAKVDELMALCDRLEAAQAVREQRRDRLAATTLGSLRLESVSAASARFAVTNVERFMIRENHVSQLRETMIDLAVVGKLVQQDPREEPAARLLAQVVHECQSHGLARGSAGKDSTQPEATATSPPRGWEVVRLRDIVLGLQTGPFGSSLHQSDYVNGGTPVINPASLQDGRIVPIDKMAIGPDTVTRLQTFQLRTGDIVLARRGEMGRCAVVTEREAGWLCGTGSAVLRMPRCISSSYIAMVIGSPRVRAYLGGAAVGATMQNLNQNILLNTPLLLPPAHEQVRILARLNVIQGIITTFERHQRSAENTRVRVLDTILGGAIPP